MEHQDKVDEQKDTLQNSRVEITQQFFVLFWGVGWDCFISNIGGKGKNFIKIPFQVKVSASPNS